MAKIRYVDKIKKLREKRKAVILAHLYQPPEIQDIADYAGDSLELSRKASETDAEVIVFCGVTFMAETAKILSPEKTVLLPVLQAGCLLADLIKPEDVAKMKKDYPAAAVVCYVNTSAAVKAQSDYCCTSSNAVKVVTAIPEKEIIFIPDRNLGSYVAKQVPDKNIILWKGRCPIHDSITAREITAARDNYPDAEILVHPECRPEVVEKADFIGSTSQIINYAKKSKTSTLIIGTEQGVLCKLKKENPQKEFKLLSPEKLLCQDMKKTRLEDVFNVLNELKNEIHIDDNIREKAALSLDRMLSVS